MLAIDHLVVLLKWTVLNPLLAGAVLAYGFTSQDAGYPPFVLAALPSAVLLGWFLVWTSRLWLNHPRLPHIRANEWKNELIVLTGGASGIGALIALKLAAKGAKVVTLDIAKSNYPSIASQLDLDENQLRSVTANIHPYICDVSSSDALSKIVKSIQGLHGDATILINNAGITNSALLTDLSQSQVTRLLNVNLSAPLWLTQALLPGMLAAAKRGQACQIVTVSSIMGHVGISKMIDYCASKHGLVGFHKALRYELTSHYRTKRVRSTLVILGHVRTKLFEGIRQNSVTDFLAPSVDPVRVAETIVRSLERRSAGTIAIPWYANWTEGIALLPSWAADFVQWVSQANTSQDDMVKMR